MPLYFFDTTGPGGGCPDEEGTVLADLDAARRYARRALCEIAADQESDDDRIVVTVRVRDRTDAEVYRAAVTLAPTHASDPGSVSMGRDRPAHGGRAV